MKLLRHAITLVCLTATLIAKADEPSASKAESGVNKAEGAVKKSAPAELQLLQGAWQGFEVSQNSQSTITITITGDSFHFHRDTNFWFKTTIALPAGTNPKQLHATIKDCPPSQKDSIGKVVGAIYKIEGGTLTLAAYDISSEPPTSFEDAEEKGLSRYELRKDKPQEKNALPLKNLFKNGDLLGFCKTP